MPHSDPNLVQLEAAVEKLSPVLHQLVLVGGCATSLLVTDPGAAPPRVTEDVDLVLDAASYGAWHAFEGKLRELGFRQPPASGGFIFRWVLGDLVVDVMPTDEHILGFGNRWYLEAVRTKESRALPGGIEVHHVNAPCFLATKLAAFRSRGEGDLLASSDLEDLLRVVDGRPEIEAELARQDEGLRGYVGEELRELLADPLFADAIRAYLWSSSEPAGRFDLLEVRLRWMADLRDRPSGH